MRKIIVLSFISLDGVMQAPGGPDEDTSSGFKYGGWVFPYFDEFSGKVMDEQLGKRSDLLLGRKTYEIFAGYWPEHEQGWPGINSVTKYVASTTMTSHSWNKSVFLRDIESIRKIKNSNGTDLQVHGSANLIQTLLQNDLIDELWLKTFPLLLGRGKRLFDDGTIPAAFTLTEYKVSPKGVIIATYKRDGEVKTGSFV
jgi:dihydrofolate reductase